MKRQRCLKTGCENQPTGRIALDLGWGEGEWQVITGDRWMVCPVHAASLTIETTIERLPERSEISIRPLPDLAPE